MKSKPKSLLFVLKVGLWQSDVIVSLGQEDKALIAFLKKNGFNEENQNSVTFKNQKNKGFAILFSNGILLLRMKHFPITPYDFGALQHEIFHISTFLLGSKSLEFKEGVTDEVFAYLIQWITEEIYKRINK